jgi:ribose 5-phosphate isomerase B
LNLKQSRRKDGRVYLSIEKAYRDKATGKPRAKTIKSLGYLDVLEKEYDDPIAHFKKVALVVAESVASEESSHGILVCGTGIGMVMAANKVPGIRAALCHDTFTARAAKEHNDANVLTLGERVTGPGLACEIIETWLDASFQGGRHEKRIAKIKAIEEKYCHCSK